MCGIACIFKQDINDIVDSRVIESMCSVIKYRGPDDGGVVAGNGFGLGSRRLAILDLSPRGHMPMSSEDGRYIIVYNGEVYNFREIASKLEQFGIVFNTGTDTEVVLKAYLHYGPECLKMFNGMFAFAIYDTQGKTAFIARDRLGIKPLYYTLYNKQLIIGSELKCLWEANVPKVFNVDKFEELLSFRYVAGEDTIYKDVRKLMPGHYLTFTSGKTEIHKWWDLGNYALNDNYSPKEDTVEWYSKTFDDAVRIRKISDVPVGILLSGGLDSSSVAASLKNTGKLSSFTVRFAEKKYDEGELAKLVAENCGLDYNELSINENNVFQKTVELISGSDEPVFHGSDLFVKEIAAYAKPKVTVLLSGEGGDETLGGYVRYNPLRYPKLLRLSFIFSPILNIISFENNRARKLIKMLGLKSVENFILYNSSDIFPADLKKLGLVTSRNISYRKTVLREAQNLYPNDPLRQVMYYDTKTYLCSLLDRNDQMTMRASIECRVPFLDFRLVEGLAALPSKKLFLTNEPKSLLRRCFGARLPKEILSAKKIGFAVPWAQYYRSMPQFRDYILRIGNHKLISQVFNNSEKIDALLNAFINGDDSKFAFVNQLTNICLWYDINIEGLTFTATAPQKRKRIFYVGNFLTKHGLNPNTNVSLIGHLREHFNIYYSSEKKYKAIRLLDMVKKFLHERKTTSVLLIDVYSTDGFWYAYLLSKIARRFKIPYINILHGGNLPWRLKNNRNKSAALFGNSYKNISPSLYLNKVFSDAGFKVEYLPNFIDLDKYRFKMRPNVTCKLFWLRAFHEVYNPLLAVKAIKILVDAGYDATLCMVGPDKDGSMNEVQKMAKKLGVIDRLRISGRLSRDEWTTVSEDYDIFINTTNFDNHPVSVLEAMALGLPIVSTNVGGIPFLVDDNVTGLLTAPDDAEAFAKSIISLLKDNDKALELSKNARKKAETFTWKSLEDKWVNMINEAN